MLLFSYFNAQKSQGRQWNDWIATSSDHIRIHYRPNHFLCQLLLSNWPNEHVCNTWNMHYLRAIFENVLTQVLMMAGEYTSGIDGIAAYMHTLVQWANNCDITPAWSPLFTEIEFHRSTNQWGSEWGRMGKGGGDNQGISLHKRTSIVYPPRGIVELQHQPS